MLNLRKSLSSLSSWLAELFWRPWFILLTDHGVRKIICTILKIVSNAAFTSFCDIIRVIMPVKWLRSETLAICLCSIILSANVECEKCTRINLHIMSLVYWVRYKYIYFHEYIPTLQLPVTHVAIQQMSVTAKIHCRQSASCPFVCNASTKFMPKFQRDFYDLCQIFSILWTTSFNTNQARSTPDRCEILTGFPYCLVQCSALDNSRYVPTTTHTRRRSLRLYL